VAEALTRKRTTRKASDPRERELKRLKLSVCDDTGFRLHLATYDQPRQRDELIARVVKEAEAEKVRVTRLDLGETGPETNLVGLLRAHLAHTDLPRGWRQAVMVTGIEQRLDYAGGPEGYAFLHQANLLRDALPEAAPVPVVLWLSRMASATLPAEAPDLWHWRAANFDFTGDEAPRLELLRELSTYRQDEVGLSSEQRRKRIQMLKDLLTELEREGPPKSKRQAVERAGILLDLGFQTQRVGLLDESIIHLEEALAIYRELGLGLGEAMTVSVLGDVWERLGCLPRAIDHYEQYLLIARKIGHRKHEAEALVDLGQASVRLGQTRQAIEYFEQALAVARPVGDVQRESAAVLGLGGVYATLGEPHRAVEYYKQALEIARETGDRQAEAQALHKLGGAYSDLREPERAFDQFKQALEIAKEAGNLIIEGGALAGMGNASFNFGEPRRAIEYYCRAAEARREIGDRQAEGWTLAILSLVHSYLGETQRAIEVAREALAIAEEIEANDLVDWARLWLAKWGAPKES
jgi:tetratricopeptide (TPR) repeat protein